MLQSPSDMHLPTYEEAITRPERSEQSNRPERPARSEQWERIDRLEHLEELERLERMELIEGPACLGLASKLYFTVHNVYGYSVPRGGRTSPNNSIDLSDYSKKALEQLMFSKLRSLFWNRLGRPRRITFFFEGRELTDEIHVTEILASVSESNPVSIVIMKHLWDELYIFGQWLVQLCKQTRCPTVNKQVFISHAHPSSHIPI